MLREIRSSVLITVTIGVVMACSGPTLGWDVQQDYTNNTGQTAYDLMKIIEGEVTITLAIEDKFDSWTTWQAGGDTYLKFYNGSVADGDWTWACFNVQGDGTSVNVKGAYWTDADGNYIGDAGDPLGGESTGEEGTEPGTTDQDVTVRNRQDSVFSGSGPIELSSVYWAVVPASFALEELNEDLFIDPGITWYPESGGVLYYDESFTYSIDGIPQNQYLLFRFEAQRVGGTLTPVQEIWQMPTRLAPPIPTVSEWGLVVMTLLGLTIGTITLARPWRVRATG